MVTDNQTRIGELEESLVLFMAILTGEPADATEEEKLAAQTRLAQLMERIRGRVIK